MTQRYIDLLTRHKVKLLCIRDRLLFDENGATPILTIKNTEWRDLNPRPHGPEPAPKTFLSISGHFWPFPLRSTSSLGLFDHAVSVWSGTVCGRFCGQKRSPALAGVFRRQGRGAFFMPLTACIVPLWTGLSKSFLRRPRLRNWGTENKKRHYTSKD